jgi:hypothetical protein
MGLWEVYSDIGSSLFGFVQHPIPPWRDIAIEDDIMPTDEMCFPFSNTVSSDRKTLT